MASFLLPSSIQKRLLRYALSRLELLDTDALDLEHLEISWGTKSTLEFRDVGLRLKKLTNLLKLPPKVSLVKAQILLLRVTIPVDIYSSPIVVEVDGVVAHSRILSDPNAGQTTPKSPSTHDRNRTRSDDKSRKRARSGTGSVKEGTYGEGGWRNKDDGDQDSALPTATDLAKSFLQAEPPEEKAELEAAILSQSQNLAASMAYSDDGEDEDALGTGTGLSLPAFVANFLKGIVDRLQVRVRGIKLDLDIEVSSEGLARPDMSPTEIVTIQLKIDDVGVEGVTFDESDETEVDKKHKSAQTVTHKDGKRRVSLYKIRGSLISDPSLFTNMARSSALSSPSVTYSALSEARSRHSDLLSNPQSSTLGSVVGDPAQVDDLAAAHELSSQHGLSGSVIASDSGRFEDAAEDGITAEVGGSLLIDDESNPSNSFFNHSTYMDQVRESQSTVEDEDAKDNNLPFTFASDHDGRDFRFSKKRSSLSTPRASVYIPPLEEPSDNYFEYSRSRPTDAQPVAQSMVTPIRPRRGLAERPPSRSQPLPGSIRSAQGSGTPNASVDLNSTQENPGDEDDSGGSDESTPLGEDLAQSMIFSHEDAESMYMSALSHGSEIVKVPGAWDSLGSISAIPRSPPGSPLTQRTQQDFPDNLEHALLAIKSEKNTKSSLALSSAGLASTSTLPTSKSQVDDAPATLSHIQHDTSIAPNEHADIPTSTQSSVSSEDYAKVAKQLFNLDHMNIYLPLVASQSPANPEFDAQSTVSASNFDGENSMAYSISPNVPGAFSTNVHRQHGSPTHSHTKPQIANDTITKVGTESIEIVLGRLDVKFDVSIGKLLARLIASVTDAISDDKPGAETPQDSNQQTPAVPNLALQFRADRISLKFLERLAATTTSSALEMASSAWVKPPSQDILLRTTLKGLNISHNVLGLNTRSTVTLQKFVLGYAKESIVSFDANLRMRASTRDPPTAGVDLTINITRTPSISHFMISSLPVHVSIDLQRLDETFSWFGGLSSVLNMGSSMASNATVTLASPTKDASKSRSVRFEAPNRSEDTFPVQKEWYARIGGFVLDLVGKECTVGLDTTAVKVVGRGEGMRLSIDKVKISGPHLHRSTKVPAILAELNVTRIEFVATPRNDDLDRLLSLITPSKAKYDGDDDILLDTLLRQRRQGSVLRITIDSFKTQVKDLEDLKSLPELGEEISKLSTVAKYLPEDDRPGLLTLILFRDVDAQVSVAQSLGSFQLRATDFEVAQITFPTLTAFSINSITVHHNHNMELLGAATKIELREPKNRSPAIMARVIGDEMEPVVRVKIWNLKIEYSVPFLMTILGFCETATTEEIVEGIASSVATLTELSRPGISKFQREASKAVKDSRSPDSKAMTVDVGLGECILALNPLGLPSKILVVITEGHFSAALPKDNNTSATFDMNKGSLLVIDDIKNILPAGTAKIRRRSFDGGSSQVADLCSAGFVSVSYISSAKAIIRISSLEGEAEKYIDVELHDDLLVLESCADSTQTLVATLNALKPPTPPSQEIKYRTKVIPVQDLLASLSGDAFGTAEGNYDFDEDFGPGLGKDIEDGAEDGNAHLAYDSHYYQEDNSIDFQENGDYEESRAGSILFDQLQSHDTSDGVLLESFHEQEQVHIQEDLEFHEDHFGDGSILEGTAHRWNSAKNTYDRSNDHKARKGPLRVCVRDVHIIWNLFDGYDWQHTREAISKAVQEVQSKAIEQRARNERRPTFDQDIAEEETVIGDFLFNSIYIGIPANRDPRELANAINQELNDNATETESVTTTTQSASPSQQGNVPRIRGKKLRLYRSKHHKITFELRGLNVDFVAFPPGSGETESSIDVRVYDFDIFDHVPTSTWKKFATYMHDAGERETGTSQIHLEILNVKPIPELAASEIVLKATVLPLRLHVDQDALDFITRFFEFKDDSAPINTSQGEVPFLQRVEVNSIPVKLDFKPKRVDYAGLRSGHTTEFMNFLVLDEADMVLRHTIIYGISGFDKLGKCLNDIWMPDIKRNQLPGILAGLAPVRSLANVGVGMRDLVVIPMREYRKDGRIVRSISKGAISFARTTGTEIVKLGAKLAVGTQTVLQGAEEFLSKPVNPSSPSTTIGWEDDALDEEEQQKQISAYADQPIGVVQGLRGGYASLERDLIMARDAIIAVPGEVMESGTAQGAVGAVLKRAPTVILRPVMGVTKALGQTLMGATNSLDPQNRRRIEDKYKKH